MEKFIATGALTWLREYISGTGSGDTVTVKIRRDSDGYWWNFTTLAFAAPAASGAMTYDADSVWKASFTPSAAGSYSVWITYGETSGYHMLEAVGTPAPAAIAPSTSITTIERVKTMLGITSSTHDAMITALIPVVEKEYLAIRGRAFDTVVEGDRFGVGDGVTKVFTLTHYPILASPTFDGVPTRITLASAQPMTTVRVGGSAITPMSYSINLTTGEVTFVSAPDAGKRLEADYEAVNPVYPDGAELTAVQMIGYRINTKGNIGEASKSLGDHTVSFEKTNMRGGYPVSITGAIERFAKFV